MLAVLQFIFQDFWHFAGALLLLYLLCEAVRTTLVGIAVGHGLQRRKEGDDA